MTHWHEVIGLKSPPMDSVWVRNRRGSALIPGHCYSCFLETTVLIHTSQNFLKYTIQWVLVYSSEKAMASHSSILPWTIPWTEEPGRLQSMGSLPARHDWATSLSLFTFMLWRRIWQPTPVFLPGESQERRSLVGCCLWGLTESDMTEAT